MDIPDFGSDLIGVVLRTAIVYICLVLGFRFLGKRQAGQLSTLDLVVLLVISNAVQNAMVGENTSLIGGLVAAAVILVLDLALHAAADRWAPLRDALDGEPTLLVDQGVILTESLRKEGISDRELAVALRMNQLMSAEEALYVFLETNGQISVIPRRDDSAPEPEAGSDGPSENGDPTDAANPRDAATAAADPANPRESANPRDAATAADPPNADDAGTTAGAAGTVRKVVRRFLRRRNRRPAKRSGGSG